MWAGRLRCWGGVGPAVFFSFCRTDALVEGNLPEPAFLVLATGEPAPLKGGFDDRIGVHPEPEGIA